MDPRNFTVRPCPAAYAAKSVADITGAGGNRKDFFNSVGKIGDLEVLNDIGGGPVGESLRLLANISNTVRTGCGALPTIIGESIDTGANWVLSNLGFAPTVIEALKQFHPEIANQAWGQAQQIYQKIQNGTFTVAQIPDFLQDFQNLERLGRAIFTSGNDRLNSLSPACEASPYAIDLIARAPKFKFMFIVQFVTAPGYDSLDEILRGMAFVVKKSSRPKITFHTEDVNYYNYRTKLITRTEYDEMSMSFHDDITNNTTKVYNAYLRALSPAANQSPEIVPVNLEQEGMSFVENTLTTNLDSIENSIPVNTYAASLGPQVQDNKQQIFKKIVLYHIFDNGNTVTVYHFVNPRVTQLVPDDVDMSIGSEGNELTMTFVYDYVYVDTSVPMSKLTQVFEAAQSTAEYVLHDNPSSASVGPSNNPNALNPFGPPTSGSISCDPMNPENTSSGPVPGVINNLTSLL